MSIHLAAHANNLARVLELIEQDGALLDAPKHSGGLTINGDTYIATGATPLMYAIAGKHDALAMRLLEMGARVDIYTSKRDTAAHWACTADCVAILQELHARGADLSVQNEWGRTPLMCAAYTYSACLRFLLSLDPEAIAIDAQDYEAATALHAAVSKANNMETVDLLLQAGADPTSRMYDQITPMQAAKAYGHSEYISMLEAAVAEPQRVILLAKARYLPEAARNLTHMARNALLAGTPMRGRKTQCIAAAPACLKQRVKEEKPLPDVHVSGHVNPLDEDEAELIGVLHHVTTDGLSEDVMKELLHLMTPRWLFQQQQQEEEKEEEEDEEEEQKAGAGGWLRRTVKERVIIRWLIPLPPDSREGHQHHQPKTGMV